MRLELTEMTWLDQRHALSLSELAELSGLPMPDLEDLVGCGVIAPVDPGAATPTFSADWVIVARTATRLRRDFELDAHGLSLALTLLDRVHRLEAQLRELEAQLPRHSTNPR